MKTKKATKYAWAAGARFKGNPADAHAALNEIRAKHGTLTPEATVEEARDEGSPLHQEFIWDDAEAAHEHRLNTARRLIRAVVVIEPRKPERREFVYVGKVLDEEDNKVGSYEPVKVVVKSQDMLRLALDALMSKLNAAVNSVEELKGAAGTREQSEMVEIIMKSLNVALATVKKIAA